MAGSIPPVLLGVIGKAFPGAPVSRFRWRSRLAPEAVAVAVEVI